MPERIQDKDTDVLIALSFVLGPKSYAAGREVGFFAFASFFQGLIHDLKKNRLFAAQRNDFWIGSRSKARVEDARGFSGGCKPLG